MSNSSSETAPPTLPVTVKASRWTAGFLATAPVKPEMSLAKSPRLRGRCLPKARTGPCASSRWAIRCTKASLSRHPLAVASNSPLTMAPPISSATRKRSRLTAWYSVTGWQMLRKPRSCQEAAASWKTSPVRLPKATVLISYCKKPPRAGQPCLAERMMAIPSFNCCGLRRPSIRWGTSLEPGMASGWMRLLKEGEPKPGARRRELPYRQDQ